MASNWQEFAVGEIGEVVGGSTPSTKVPGNFDGDIPWLTPKDLSGTHPRFIKRGARNLSQRGLESSSARLVPAGTVLLSTRAPIGYVAIAANPIATNQGFRSIIVNPNFDPQFVYYWLRANTEELERHANGSTFRELSGGSLRQIRLTAPPLAEQRAIAHVLGALDDKIELNRWMSETLETMARELFKSWFVDFDAVHAKAEGRDPRLPPKVSDLLPDSFEDSELGEIPAGWKLSSIGEVAEVIDCLHSKKPERRATGKPLIQLDNLRSDGLLDLSEPFLIDESDYRLWTSRMEATTGDCVITNVGRVGAVAQLPEGTRAALGRNMTGIRCRTDFPYPAFLIEALRSDHMADEISLRTDSGTILDALNVRNIPRLRIIIPTESVLQEYDAVTHSLRARMEAALRESHSLARVRDALSPQFLSGELRADARRFRGVAS
jgi:type I restriction enzyme S subunit